MFFFFLSAYSRTPSSFAVKWRLISVSAGMSNLNWFSIIIAFFYISCAQHTYEINFEKKKTKMYRLNNRIFIYTVWLTNAAAGRGLGFVQAGHKWPNHPTNLITTHVVIIKKLTLRHVKEPFHTCRVGFQRRLDKHIEFECIKECKTGRSTMERNISGFTFSYTEI